MPAAHALSGSFSDDDRSIGHGEAPDPRNRVHFKVHQGGKAKAPKARRAKTLPRAKVAPKAESLRPLLAREALGLAWAAGLVHDIHHENSEVLIDEGSTPVEGLSLAVSTDTWDICDTRRYLASKRVSRHGWRLREAGRRELNRQIREGHLAALKLQTIGVMKDDAEARAPESECPGARPSAPRVSVCWPGRRYVEFDPEYTAEQYNEERWAIGGGR
jgi:hypothetical protein